MYRIQEYKMLIELIYENKKMILIVMCLFGSVSLLYALKQPKWYSAEILVSEVSEKDIQGNLSSGMNTLAGFAGINLGKSSKKDEIIAALESKQFLIEFISKNKINEDIGNEKNEIQQYYFFKNMLDINEDVKTGLINISIEWKDEDKAVKWANEIVKAINLRYKEEDEKEARLALAFLNKSINETKVVQIKQSINELVERQMKKLMLIDSKNEYVLKVIDPAINTNKIIKPKKRVIVLFGLVVGVIVSATILLVKYLKDERNYKNIIT